MRPSLATAVTAFIVALSLIPSSIAETSTPNTGDQLQGFQFSFTDSTVVLPVTYTCPSPLTVFKTAVASDETDDPTAPYTMVTLVHEQLYDGAGQRYERTYSKTLYMGDMGSGVDVSHPWGNGTQFIACMWAANGVSGGCQDLVTVVPSPSLTEEAYASENSTCRTSDRLGSWVTPANETLSVDVTGVNGDVAINAWPAACSDLQITPRNGTAPYTLLVAPASHPPVNITSSTGDPMNYTVRLTHGQAFMLALYDSAGDSWVYGPLHSGDSDDLSCLAVATGEEAAVAAKGNTVGIGALIGGVVGSFVVGAVVSILIIWLLGAKPRRQKKTPSDESSYTNLRPASYRASSGSMYTKGIFTDDPPSLEYDGSGTLYDPHDPGSHGASTRVPRQQSVNSDPALSPPMGRDAGDTSAANGQRPFPRPPSAHHGSEFEYPVDYITPFDHQSDAYRDSLPLADYKPRRESHPPHQPCPPGNTTQPTQDSSCWTSRQPLLPSGNTSGHHLTRSGSGSVPSPSPRPGSHQSNTADHQAPPSSPSSARAGGRHVYIVHADGGGADVTIHIPDADARVIELPPGYRRNPPPSSPPALTSLPTSGITDISAALKGKSNVKPASTDSGTELGGRGQL